jgi:hypothetical protein
MADLKGALRDLRKERTRISAQLGRIDEVIAGLEGLTGRKSSGGAGRTGVKRVLSAAARKRIATAQKLRWAKYREKQGSRAA